MRSGRAANAGVLSIRVIDKANAEIFSVMYGSLVVQILKDNKGDCMAANRILDEMGHSIGIRIIEEFLAKSGIPLCSGFREACDVIAAMGFKSFLGVNAETTKWDAAGRSCTLIIHDNVLNDFVEIPNSMKGDLWYSSIYCGVIRGAFEQLQLKVHAYFIADVLRGSAQTEIVLELHDILLESLDEGNNDSEYSTLWCYSSQLSYGLLFKIRA